MGQLAEKSCWTNPGATVSNGPTAGRGLDRPAGRTWKGYAIMKYVCDVCGYVYDPEAGDPEGEVVPGTPFEELPDGWVCPECGVSKDEFSPADE